VIPRGGELRPRSGSRDGKRPGSKSVHDRAEQVLEGIERLYTPITPKAVQRL